MPRESVLVIDDEKDLQKLISYNLEKEGYDVIVLDLMLPQIDGLEVCRLLKAEKETKHIPIVMLTAKSTEIDEVVGLELGASDYIAKPFSVKVLLARLKSILKNKALPRDEASIFKCCELVLDKDCHRFSIKGKTVDFTKMEFRILTILIENPKVVISREQLVSKVWGDGSFVSKVAVNMQIKSLREKLGKYRDYIETVRGSGFRFC